MISIAIICLLCTAGGCSYVNEKLGLAPDNQYEELIETVIEANLDIPEGSIDLTPESEE